MLKKQTLNYCCATCKEPLVSASQGAGGDNATKNTVLMCEKCKAQYPVINDIPRFVDINNYSESFGYQWNIHRRTQLDSYTGKPISQDRLFAVTGWKGDTMRGKRVLEAGSGAGRFTEVLLKMGVELFSFDFSRAVEANFKNNGLKNNLTLFQGDIFNIPFLDASFDHVICLGVIQHTPDPQKAFVSLANKVKPGGSLYIDVYTRSWAHLLQWKYLLRPLTKRIDRNHLYLFLSKVIPLLIYPTRLMKRLFGKAGGRLMPIVEYSNLGLSNDINREWAILDTFDMYSPAHDHPQSLSAVQNWFEKAGFVDVSVWYGANGVVGRGRKPACVE